MRGTIVTVDRTDGGRSPRRGQAREQAILDAATELIGELGYERITVDAIAARARASKATMYRRWPGKAELVADALRRHAEGESPGIPDTGSLRGDLVAVVTSITSTFGGGPGPSLLGLVEGIRDDAALREVVGAQIRQHTREVRRLVCEQATARGEVVDPDVVDTVLDVAFAQLFAQTLFHGVTPNAAAQEHLVDAVLLPLLRRAP